MILFNGPNTPFGRMALVAALDLGLVVENRVIRVAEAEFLDGHNPLRQIPTLLLDDGRAVFDSRVICRYFASLAPGGAALVPDDLAVETRWALAVGLMEAAVALRLERIRPDGERSPSAMAANQRRIDKTIARLENESQAFQTALRIDRVATAVALDYIEFRHGNGWRDKAPCLSCWMERETERASMRATPPLS